MKTVRLTVGLINAWEDWIVDVPDECPDDPSQALAWIENSDFNYDMISLQDSGNSGWEFVEAQVI